MKVNVKELFSYTPSELFQFRDGRSERKVLLL